MQYRANLGMMLLSMLVVDGAMLLFLNVIFDNIPQLQGWLFHEVLVMYGLTMITSNLAGTILNIPWDVPGYIRSGYLDIFLVRPPSPLFQILSRNCFEPSPLGRILVGGAAIAVGLNYSGLPFRWWWLAYLPIVVISGTLLKFGLLLIVACLGFWFINVIAAIFPVNWLSDFVQFPITIYSPMIQFLLTWTIPYAWVSFYPAAFLTRGDAYQVHGLIAPGVGVIFLGLALIIWRLSLKSYQSTGS